MQGFLKRVTGLAVVLGFCATVLGLLAPWLPLLELINHFRPFMLAGAGALLFAASSVRSRALVLGAALLFAANLGLALLPVAFQAPAARSAANPFKVVSLNLYYLNRDVEAVARFLEAERADAVVLQEAYHLHGALIERVKGSYPHSYCPDEDCTVALLSRTRPLQVGKEDVPPRKPLLVWAEIPFGERTVKVVGLHLPFPFDPEYQAEHVEWLIDYMWQHPRATAVAGDFNLTPFSLKLVKLMRWTGLRAHLTWRFSWPTHMGFPLVLLDNVLTTPDLGTVSARLGPNVGSDHYPVIVELGWR